MTFCVLALAAEYSASYVVAYYSGSPVLALELDNRADEVFCQQSSFKVANSVILAAPCTILVQVSGALADPAIFVDSANVLSAITLDSSKISAFFRAESTRFPDGWNCFNNKQSVAVSFLNYPVAVAQSRFLNGQNQIQFNGTSVFVFADGNGLQIINATADLRVASELALLPTTGILACASCQQEFVFSGKRVNFTALVRDNISVQQLKDQKWENVATAAIQSVRAQPDKASITVRTDFSGATSQYLRLRIQFIDICGNRSVFEQQFTFTQIQQYDVLYADDHYYTPCGGAAPALSCNCVITPEVADSLYSFVQVSNGSAIKFQFTGQQKMKILPYSTTQYLYYCQGQESAKFAFQMQTYDGEFKNDAQTRLCVDKEFYTFTRIPTDCRFVERKISGVQLVATYYSCLDFQKQISVLYSGFNVTHTKTPVSGAPGSGSFLVTVNASGSTVQAVQGQMGALVKPCVQQANASVYECVFTQFGTYKVYALINTECQQNERYDLFEHQVLTDAYLLMHNNAAWQPHDFTLPQRLATDYIYYYAFSTAGMQLQQATCTYEQNERQLVFSTAGNCQLQISYQGNTITYELIIQDAATVANPSCKYAASEYDEHDAALTLFENVHYSVICTIDLTIDGVTRTQGIPQDNLTVNDQPAQYFKAVSGLNFKYYAGYQIIRFTVAAVLERLSVQSVYQYDALTVNEKLAFLDSYAPTQESALSSFIVRNFKNCTQKCVVNAYYQPLSKSMVRLAKLSNYPTSIVERELAIAFVQNRLAFYRLFAPVLLEFQELVSSITFPTTFAFPLFAAVPVVPLQQDNRLSIQLEGNQAFSVFTIARTSIQQQFQTQKTQMQLTYQDMPPGFQESGCKIGIFEATSNQSVITFCAGDAAVVFTATKGQCVIHQLADNETSYSAQLYTSTQLENCTQINEAAHITCSCRIGQFGGHILLFTPPQGLSGWAIFGIVVAVLVGVALLVLVAYLLLRHFTGFKRGVRTVRKLA